MLHGWLSQRGYAGVLEQAVGRYNVDIGIAPIAVEVEVTPGNPLKSPRLRKRLGYLCDRGWLVVYVWVTRYGFMDEGAANYVAALCDAAKSDPSLVGEYRVIRGTGELIASGRPDGDEWTAILSDKSRPNRGRGLNLSLSKKAVD
jgi:hypothetical protein